MSYRSLSIFDVCPSCLIRSVSNSTMCERRSQKELLFIVDLFYGQPQMILNAAIRDPVSLLPVIGPIGDPREKRGTWCHYQRTLSFLDASSANTILTSRSTLLEVKIAALSRKYTFWHRPRFFVYKILTLRAFTSEYKTEIRIYLFSSPSMVKITLD